MHTGLTTVLGWEHHVKQRGTNENDLYMRKKDIKVIYGSTNAQVAEDLLNKYQVELIVIGELERKTYSSSGLKKFEENPDKFLLLYKSGSTSLYTRTASLLSKDDSAKLELKWK